MYNINMKKLNIPPIWTLLAVFFAVILHFVYPIILFEFRAIDLGVMAIGIYLILATPIWFKRKSTTIIPRRKPTALIVEGPFKLSRNPMYLGMVLVTFGVGMTLGSIQGLLPSVWLFLFLKKNYVLPEECKLIEAMGADAQKYFTETGRWIWFL